MLLFSVVWSCVLGFGSGLVPQGNPVTSVRRVKSSLSAANELLAAVPAAGLMLGGATLLGANSKKVEIDDKKEVEAYFNGDVGFGRWKKIYSESDDVNKVQMDIREGHALTVDKVLSWLPEKPGSWCDLGCGVGSLAIPLAQRGFEVSASDISEAMVKETNVRATEAGVSLKCETRDMETAEGSYNAVSCIDVMIHYPTDTMVGFVDKLTSLATDRIFVSFAPKTPQYTILKAIGGLFPGPSKTTRAYLHKEEDVEKALNDRGFTVKRRHLTATNFYFSLLFEAVPTNQAS